MKHLPWKSALLCSGLALTALVPVHAQNATSGGDQQPQPGAQSNRVPSQGGGNGPRRGGAVGGTVISVKGNDVTLKTEAGETWTVVSTENTRVLRDFLASSLSNIQPGDVVNAMGMPDADKHEVHAMVVMDISAAEAAKAKANLGKTYIVGRITAINDTQLTLLRSDRVSQTIMLDETTSLHRGGRPDPLSMKAAGMMGLNGFSGRMGGGMDTGGAGGGGRRQGGTADGTSPNPAGESITLADVKVGDTVVGTGAVKGGTFVPTDLHVMERPAGGRRYGGANPGAATDAPPQQ